MKIEDLRAAFIYDSDDDNEKDISCEEAISHSETILQGRSLMKRRRAILRKAVAWSEVLGEPACKKKRRKAYGGNQGNFGRGRGGNTETA